MDVMKMVYGIDIDYWKLYKALVHARELEQGTWESGYEDLPMFLHKIKAANPGTITRLICDEQDRFRFLFIAFGACINGFQFIRNVVVVDGGHLKGKFEGVLLVAALQYGNGEIFPLAFGIVDSENNASWEWFLTQLRMICADQQELVVISDRHRSIRKAVREVSEFVALFDEIQRQNPDIATYLEKADVRLWSRANFQGDRYDIMTSNISESINKVLKDARDTLTVHHIDAHRSYVTGGAFACVVDIQQRSCTCRVYDFDKIPCEHALAVIGKRPNLSLETFVHPYYTKSTLYGAYVE
ncbi:uncharacterized protein LOC112084600 [Eutrema salsugineum]|uniref:uncharacterized protein LOC112084600 n=1 Tax=Eutrema salsugineum TaxID=72664 RepID=UPI000CED256C|nr:uncharacterized protein LOC112084600 [Eutrema salsugineum]